MTLVKSQGIGPSVGLVVATWAGYDAALKAAQPMEVATTMRYVTAAFYVFSGLVQFVGLVLVYNLDTKTLTKIQEDLAARKAK